MLANYLIGLREGLEAALVVGILVAYLVRSDHRAALKPLWIGVTAAVVISLIAGALLTFTATALGYLVYRGSVHLDLGKFFRYTGAGLVVVAAGVLAYGMHDLQEAGVIGGINHVLFDATAVLPPSSWWGSLFKGMFSISAKPTLLEFSVWLAYLIPTMTLFLRPEGTAAVASGRASPKASSTVASAR